MTLAKNASMWKMGFYPNSICIIKVYPIFMNGSPMYQVIFDILINILD